MKTRNIGKVLAAFVLLTLLSFAFGCARQKTMTEYEGTPSERPDYLPEAMFKELPEMPADFYSVRDLVRSGQIADLGTVWPEYYQQPEWFPGFEESGIPLLQNPPENRWGAFGFGSYPSDAGATLIRGDTLSVNFFMRSSYLIETYQGISLVPVFPISTTIEEGYTLFDGSKEVVQGLNVKYYFDVKITPALFVLEPNFPIYAKEGTKKIELNITAKKDIPPGNYVVGVDIGGIPLEEDQKWIEEYGFGYTGEGITKIGRPYYRVFLTVGDANQTIEQVEQEEEREETEQED